MKLLLLVTFSLIMAQIAPSCGGIGEFREVIGWVDEKFVQSPHYLIVINHVHYNVPFPFWHRVQIGDLVKYDGYEWTIVRPAGQ